VLGVTAQIAAIRTQGVGRDAALDREVVEVALKLVIQGGPEGGHVSARLAAKAFDLSIHGASTGRSDDGSSTSWAARIPATAMEFTISPASTIRLASSRGNHFT
jgi:hypothetical protein